MALVLALDIGSSSVRAAVCDDTGDVVHAVEPRRYDLRPGGVLDPERLLRDTVAATHEALADDPVDAAGGSCFWHSLLALDETGRPLTPLLSWRDVRSAAHADDLARRVDAREVYARTGCPLHASFWPAKLSWLAAEHAEAFAGARHFVGFGDWLLEQQTGELRTSVSMASATGLRSEGGWDAELLDTLGIDDDQLPEVSDDPVDDWHPLLGDGACSNLGSGCATPDRAALNVGTSAAIRVVTDEPAAEGLFRYRVDADRAIVGGALSAGGNLHAWLDETLRVPDAAQLAERPPAAHGLTFLPLLAGERSPGWKAGARGSITGLTFETTPLDLLQAGLEAVAFELRRVADLLPPVEQIIVSGGALAENADWLQIVADVLERRLHVSSEPEASLRGAAVYVLARLGHEPPAPAVDRVVEPRADRAEAYRAAFERHRQLYETLT